MKSFPQQDSVTHLFQPELSPMFNLENSPEVVTKPIDNEVPIPEILGTSPNLANFLIVIVGLSIIIIAIAGAVAFFGVVNFLIAIAAVTLIATIGFVVIEVINGKQYIEAIQTIFDFLTTLITFGRRWRKQ